MTITFSVSKMLFSVIISSLLILGYNCDTNFFLNLDSTESQLTEFNSNGVESNHVPHENNVEGVINYQLGVRLPGDVLAGVAAKNQTWPRAQNVAVTFSYPSSGTGRQVTYVLIQVSQTSNLGQAYVIGGGLHQRNIRIKVEAYNTYYLNYTAQIYGV